MSTLPAPDDSARRRKASLALVPLDDDALKLDNAILDRYQTFSAELLRISLLAIPAVGFLLTTFLIRYNDKIIFNAFKDLWVCRLSSGALICFGLSAAGALAHRYISSDSMADQVQFLRLVIRDAPAEGDRMSDEARGEKIRRKRNRKLSLSRWSLIFSSALLFLGAICLAAAFVAAIWHLKNTLS